MLSLVTDNSTGRRVSRSFEHLEYRRASLHRYNFNSWGCRCGPSYSKIPAGCLYLHELPLPKLSHPSRLGRSPRGVRQGVSAKSTDPHGLCSFTFLSVLLDFTICSWCQGAGQVCWNTFHCMGKLILLCPTSTQLIDSCRSFMFPLRPDLNPPKHLHTFSSFSHFSILCSW